jgi:C1A family cysteine protease
MISRLFHYYCGRLLSGLSNLEDTGLDIRSACNIVKKIGACRENVWPYNTNNFDIMPSLATYQSTKLFRTYTYTFIVPTGQRTTVDNIKSFMTTNNSPVLFGLMVYSSFMTNQVANTGVIPLPNTTNEPLEGGHCMLIVGYNDSTKMVKCVNSWGTGWGARGFCYIPYAYINNANLCSDFCGFVFLY